MLEKEGSQITIHSCVLHIHDVAQGGGERGYLHHVPHKGEYPGDDGDGRPYYTEGEQPWRLQNCHAAGNIISVYLMSSGHAPAGWEMIVICSLLACMLRVLCE